MNEQQIQNMLLKIDQLSSIRRKLSTQVEKLDTSAKLRVIVSDIPLLSL